MKKVTSIILAVLFASSISMTAFAAVPGEPDFEEKVLIECEVDTIEDNEGNIYEIEMRRYRSRENVSTRGIFPEHEVGYRDTFEFRVTNNQLGIIGFVGGTPVSKEVKKKIADIVSEKLSQKIGANLLPGINIASWVLSGIGALNAVCGKTGFIASVECEYSSVFIHSQGHDMYGWDLKDIDLSTY